jgi:hypothetical protein
MQFHCLSLIFYRRKTRKIIVFDQQDFDERHKSVDETQHYVKNTRLFYLIMI